MLHNHSLTKNPHHSGQIQYVSYVSQVLPNLKIRLKMFFNSLKRVA